MTSKTLLSNAAYNRLSDGISRTQGAHQVAQKFISTTLPRLSARLTGATRVSATGGSVGWRPSAASASCDPATADGILDCAANAATMAKRTNRFRIIKPSITPP